MQISPLHSEILSQISDGFTSDEKHSEIEWRQLQIKQLQCNNTEIEPGESDTFHFDFIIQEPVRIVEVYSYVQNIIKKNRDIGWPCTNIHEISNDLGDDNNAKRESLKTRRRTTTTTKTTTTAKASKQTSEYS